MNRLLVAASTAVLACAFVVACSSGNDQTDDTDVTGTGGYPLGGGFGGGAYGGGYGVGGAPVSYGGSLAGSGGLAPFGAGGIIVGTGGVANAGGGFALGSGGFMLGTGGLLGGSGDGASTGGSIGATGGSAGVAGERPPCLKRPSQVVALGDSYVASPVVLVPKIVSLAIADGALAPGQTYRDYADPGTTLDTPPGSGSIPPQWTTAKRSNADIEAVIMDGGGNDIIQSIICLAPGSNTNPVCTDIVDRVMAVVQNMATDMKATGVKDVVYFLYPHVPLGGNDILDYAVVKAQAMAVGLTTASFRVYLVDPRQAFNGHPEYFGTDPVHTNATGAQVIARLVWDTMKAHCIAQPASSGCCAP